MECHTPNGKHTPHSVRIILTRVPANSFTNHMSYNEVHNVFLVLDLYSNHCTCLSDVESQGFSMFFKLRGHQPDSSALFGGQAIAKSKHVKLLRNERDIWINYIYILVGGFNPSEKKVSWADYSQCMGK